jgi:hypothetical protein
MIDSSLYAWLVENVSDGWTVQEGKLDWDRSLPWVWFRRAGTIQERMLGGALVDNFTTDIDVEFVDTDIDAVQTQADSIKTALQTITPGTIVGSTFCHGIFVNEHSDDYIPKTILDTDEGLHLATFSVRIFHRA